MADDEVRYLGDEVIVGAIQKLTLAPGDVIVISMDQFMDDDAASYVRDLVRKKVGDYEVMILSGGVKIGVLTKVGDKRNS